MQDNGKVVDDGRMITKNFSMSMNMNKGKNEGRNILESVKLSEFSHNR